LFPLAAFLTAALTYPVYQTVIGTISQKDMDIGGHLSLRCPLELPAEFTDNFANGSLAIGQFNDPLSHLIGDENLAGHGVQQAGHLVFVVNPQDIKPQWFALFSDHVHSPQVVFGRASGLSPLYPHGAVLGWKAFSRGAGAMSTIFFAPSPL
jgi:hypothetical protein